MESTHRHSPARALMASAAPHKLYPRMASYFTAQLRRFV